VEAQLAKVATTIESLFTGKADKLALTEALGGKADKRTVDDKADASTVFMSLICYPVLFHAMNSSSLASCALFCDDFIVLGVSSSGFDVSLLTSKPLSYQPTNQPTN